MHFWTTYGPKKKNQREKNNKQMEIQHNKYGIRQKQFWKFIVIIAYIKKLDLNLSLYIKELEITN